jgi:eukaryotic-like serine/threonine-protein kinase
VLGRGATGVVYAARDPELAREVAVKVLRPQVPSERLRREAQALAKLTHPNVVRIYDVGVADGEVFIAMELVRGQNLREWLAGTHDFDEILRVIVEAGRGLAAAHRAGLVHRDFKPDNVLIADGGGVLVGDFGLARLAAEPARSRAPTAGGPDGELALAETLESGPPHPPAWRSLTSTGALVGTPAYMAPEQATEDATAAADQFAFCVTAWEAGFGARPFDGLTLAELWAGIRAGAFAEPATTTARGAAFAAVLRRGLAADPAARYPTMDELLRALTPPARPRRTWAIGAAAAIAAGGAAIGALHLAAPADEPIACELAGEAMTWTWTPEARATIAARWTEAPVKALDRFAATWQRQRVEACHATHRDGIQPASVLARRVDCLERARTAFAQTVETFRILERDLWASDVVIDSLPVLERCIAPRDTEVTVAALVRAAVRTTVELDLLELDLEAAASGSAAPAKIAALRARIEQLDEPSLLTRIIVLEARAATYLGRRDEAEALLRRAIVRSEAELDDLGRVRALAELARIIAAKRSAEAAELVRTARAALERTRGDASFDLALLEAEVEVALGRGDKPAAIALQRRRVAQAEARYGTSNLTVLAHTRLAGLLHDNGEIEASTAELAVVGRLSEQLAKAYGLWNADMAVLTEDSLAPMIDGRFDDALAVARRQIAVARRFRLAQIETKAHETIALVHELEFDYAAAYEAWHVAIRLWRRPIEEFAIGVNMTDPVDVANSRTYAQFSAAYALIGMGRPADAVREFDAAFAELRGDTAMIKELTLSIGRRQLGVALVEAGQLERAREVLVPLEDSLSELPPMTRALARFALGRALWSDTQPSGDRARQAHTRALLADAERDLDGALELAKTAGAYRNLPAFVARTRARIARWREDH